MPLFRVSSSIESTLGHPLVTGPLLQDGTVVFDAAAPVPSVSEVPAGFDAIFQFTTPLLGNYLDHVLGSTAYEYSSYDTSNLSPAAKREILTRLQAALRGSMPASTSGGTPVIVVIGGTGSSGGTPTPQITELPTPLAFRVTAHRPSIQLAAFPGGPFDAGVEWIIGIEVGVPESTPSGVPGGVIRPGLTLAVDAGGSSSTIGFPSAPAPGTPAGTGTTLRFVPLTEGAALTQAAIRLGTAATQYQVWARLDFAGSKVDIRAGGDPLFTELRDSEVNSQLTNGILDALALVFARSDLNITPRMALGGTLRSNEQLAGLQGFRVTYKTGFGNRRLNRVLSICVNTGPNNATGDVALVRPFVDDGNCAYYLAEPIVRAALLVRWARLQQPLEFTAMVPLQMELADNPGVAVQGSGSIRYRILDVADVLFEVTTVDLPDAVRVSGNSEFTLLKAWNDRNREIQDLGDYASPAIRPFTLRIYPFGGVPPLPPGPAKEFFESIVTQILEPVDRPSAEVIRMSGVAGRISSPLHALVVRGQLSF